MTAAAQPEPVYTGPRLVAAAVTGSTRPRLWTRPLRRLTPATSKGFAVIAFAATLGIELLPWQKWVLIHALELNPDGGYRFRTVLILVSRQNGKTTLLKVLALWRMIEDRGRMVLGTSTNLEYAREAWNGSVEILLEQDERNGFDPDGGKGAGYRYSVGRGRNGSDDGQPTLHGFELPDSPARPAGARLVKSVKYGALDTSLTLVNGARYKVAVAGRRGGRSLSVDLGIADELREHKDWSAWSALSGTTTARPDPQLWALSNMGDPTSIVLNDFRARGVQFIETGEGDPTLGLFEYSAEPGCEVTSVPAWQQGNPGLGYTLYDPSGQVVFHLDQPTLLGKSKLPAELFRTEHLCQMVETEDPAVSAAGWRAGEDPTGTMTDLRPRIVCVLDAAPDLAHITLVAAGLLADRRVRLEVVRAWTSAAECRAELPDLIARVRPRYLGWFPNGPAAGLAVELRKIRRGVELGAGLVPAICQGFAEQIEGRRVLHPGDPLLTAHVLGATRVPVQDGGWRFARKGVGHVDAAYAAAGAVHLAREKLTKSVKLELVLPN